MIDSKSLQDPIEPPRYVAPKIVIEREPILPENEAMPRAAGKRLRSSLQDGRGLIPRKLMLENL
jgi:hypothetical protein